MACKDEIHKDDVGTEFKVIIQKCVDDVLSALDISTSTAREIQFKKSDGTVLTKTAVYTSPSSGGTGDGTDGKISYFAVAGDLDLTGNYKLQGVVTNPAGKWYSTIKKFKVYPNL